MEKEFLEATRENRGLTRLVTHACFGGVVVDAELDE